MSFRRRILQHALLVSITMPAFLICALPATLVRGEERQTQADSPKTQVSDSASDPASQAGLHGGLVVQLGGSDVTAAASLSKTGRYLVHVLDPDAEATRRAQSTLRETGHYGLTWAEQPVDSARLPYAENVVNMVIVRDYGVPIEELKRVVTPGGSIVVTNEDVIAQNAFDVPGFETPQACDEGFLVRKRWPSTMDVWSHARHDADGNAVSLDTEVGPPKRVRWIAAATSEVEGMVSAGGKNFYGGILARDSFNGLRLWHRDLAKAGENNPQEFSLPRLARDGSRPVASDAFLFGKLKDRVVAMDAATGEVKIDFAEMKAPRALLYDGTRVVAADNESVRAYDIDSGKELWRFPSAEPSHVVVDGKFVAFVQGRVKRGEPASAVTLDAKDGSVIWTNQEFPWLVETTRTVLFDGSLVFEVSTLNDHDSGNGIHVVDADTGKHRWSKEYPPGMNHARQARAMFLDNDIWILHGGKLNTNDKEKLVREKPQVSALDPQTGEVRVSYPAGLAHCFPPVATPNYLFAGELDMTDLKSGEVVANRITKANCSRDSGWIPANGLIYTTPKHCTCWPMLRGFVAMAKAAPNGSAVNQPVDEMEFLLVKGPASPDPQAAEAEPDDWPLYRHDRWRSASTASVGPKELNENWSTTLAQEIESRDEITGPILHDWNENPVVKGPLSAPTVSGGLAYVTRSDAHELIALDAESGEVRWRFTANGRLDTPPAIHRGLCLFGSAAGWVYALRADTGDVVWKLRAAPSDERIVAYGQVESPWPVPGAILVMDDIAYFAAGRQPLADGGILVFAVDPMTGQRHWVQRIDTVPQKGFYENSGLEFDPFDILHAEGDKLAMSRWILSLDGKEVDVDKWNAFAKINTGEGEAWIPRGSWTYGARHQDRFRGEASRRPLTVFRDDKVFSSLDGSTNIFRRDFNEEDVESFNSKWITGWEAVRTARDGGKPYRNQRIATNSLWVHDPFNESKEAQPDPTYGTELNNEVYAMALAGNKKLYVVHRDGRMKVINTETGYPISETSVPEPAWDGLAIANGKVFLTTADGKLICLGE